MTALNEVNGIGPSLAEALVKHGFDSAESIAAATPEALVAVPGIGAASAPRLIEAAKEVAGGTDAPALDPAPEPELVTPVPDPVVLAEPAKDNGEPKAEPEPEIPTAAKPAKKKPVKKSKKTDDKKSKKTKSDKKSKPEPKKSDVKKSDVKKSEKKKSEKEKSDNKKDAKKKLEKAAKRMSDKLKALKKKLSKKSKPSKKKKTSK